MSEGVSYRGYLVYHDGCEYVAEPITADGDNFEISSKNRPALLSAIDELWSHLEGTKSIHDKSSVPTWYRSWLDDGACGRVRLTEHGMHESIAPRRWRLGWGKISAAVMACAVALLGVPRLDVNGDGRIDLEDYSSLIEKAYLAHPPSSSHQRIRFDKRVYDVMLTPAPDDDVDFDARDIKIGVSVKNAAVSSAVAQE